MSDRGFENPFTPIFLFCPAFSEIFCAFSVRLKKPQRSIYRRIRTFHICILLETNPSSKEQSADEDVFFLRSGCTRGRKLLSLFKFLYKSIKIREEMAFPCVNLGKSRQCHKEILFWKKSKEKGKAGAQDSMNARWLRMGLIMSPWWRQ